MLVIYRWEYGQYINRNLPPPPLQSMRCPSLIILKYFPFFLCFNFCHKKINHMVIWMILKSVWESMQRRDSTMMSSPWSSQCQRAWPPPPPSLCSTKRTSSFIQKYDSLIFEIMHIDREIPIEALTFHPELNNKKSRQSACDQLEEAYKPTKWLAFLMLHNDHRIFIELIRCLEWAFEASSKWVRDIAAYIWGRKRNVHLPWSFGLLHLMMR